MGQRRRMLLSAVVLDSPDPQALAGFYRRLLDWEAAEDGPEWVELVPPGGGTGLSFQREASYVRPAWPAGPGESQMMLHLDLQVDELEDAVAHAVAAGAVVAEHQPQEHVRVCLDPAGHPFCLFVQG